MSAERALVTAPTARDRAIEVIEDRLAQLAERIVPDDVTAAAVVEALLARREVLRELLNESKGEHAEGLAGEELPFLVRVEVGRAVRAIVDRWHAAGSSTDPEVLRALPGAPDVTEDRAAIERAGASPTREEAERYLSASLDARLELELRQRELDAAQAANERVRAVCVPAAAHHPSAEVRDLAIDVLRALDSDTTEED